MRRVGVRFGMTLGYSYFGYILISKRAICDIEDFKILRP